MNILVKVGFCDLYSPLLEGCPQGGVFICLSQTGFFLLTTKETKLPAENFCFEVSTLAHIVHPQKFVRPVKSRTGRLSLGLVGWKFKMQTMFLLFDNKSN